MPNSGVIHISFLLIIIMTLTDDHNNSQVYLFQFIHFLAQYVMLDHEVRCAYVLLV